MIIDKILDRKDDDARGRWYEYNARDFYFYLMRGGSEYDERISRALDAGTNEDIQRELIIYCVECGYNIPEIIDYIKSVDWLQN